MSLLPARSPGGQPTCPYVGPLTSRVLWIAESPAAEEIKGQEPLIGRAGKLFNKALQRCGIARHEQRIGNLVPARAPGSGDQFANHSAEDMEWGRAILQAEIDAMPNLELIVCLGGNPSDWIQGLSAYGGITKWRGSLFPAEAEHDEGDPDWRYNEYWRLLHRTPRVTIPDSVATIATFHPAAVLRQFPWHHWLTNDLERVRRWLAGDSSTRIKRRRWFVNRPEELSRFATEVLGAYGAGADGVAHGEHMVAVDTEMSPQICCLTSEEEVHVFHWSERARQPVTDIMTSPWVLKVAHNMAHDWRQFEVYWGITVARPYFDTICGAHVLEPSGFDPGGDREETAGEQMVGKSLSPHIATAFTPWIYHKKWLEALDQLHYCGVDTVVAYDAYWPQVEALQRTGRMEIAEYDHRLWGVLFQMQRDGVLVDESARAEAEVEIGGELARVDGELTSRITPIIQAAHDRGRLQNPHLFKERRVCECCRGASKKVKRCWSCAGFDHAPSLRELKERYPLVAGDGGKRTKAEFEELVLHTCAVCKGAGEFHNWLPFNWNSDSQVADLFYRAMSIPARTYQGKETVRFDQLEETLRDGGYLAQGKGRDDARYTMQLYVRRAELNAELGTVKRLTPGFDGRLRSNFDPWYTPTGRVASREGLFDVGTNLQNIPEPARRMVVADPGHCFGYPDYEQIEGRAVAVLSRDPAFMALYSAGTDSHNAVREMMLDLVDLPRQNWKRFNFAALYGIGDDHAAEILGVPLLAAMKVKQRYFTRFAGVKRWWGDVEREIVQTRSNTSPTGWVRRWLGYTVHTSGKRRGQVIEKVLKEALATSPQNIGARVLGEGILALQAAAPWIRPAAHVHDATLNQIPLGREAEAIHAIETHMVIEKWGMRFTTKASLGPNWYVASLKDEEKVKQGYEEWTREAILNRA